MIVQISSDWTSDDTKSYLVGNDLYENTMGAEESLLILEEEDLVSEHSKSELKNCKVLIINQQTNVEQNGNSEVHVKPSDRVRCHTSTIDHLYCIWHGSKYCCRAPEPKLDDHRTIGEDSFDDCLNYLECSDVMTDYENGIWQHVLLGSEPVFLLESDQDVETKVSQDCLNECDRLPSGVTYANEGSNNNLSMDAFTGFCVSHSEPPRLDVKGDFPRDNLKAFQPEMVITGGHREDNTSSLKRKERCKLPLSDIQDERAGNDEENMENSLRGDVSACIKKRTSNPYMELYLNVLDDSVKGLNTMTEEESAEDPEIDDFSKENRELDQIYTEGLGTSEPIEDWEIEQQSKNDIPKVCSVDDNLQEQDLTEEKPSSDPAESSLLVIEDMVTEGGENHSQLIEFLKENIQQPESCGQLDEEIPNNEESKLCLSDYEDRNEYIGDFSKDNGATEEPISVEYCVENEIVDYHLQIENDGLDVTDTISEIKDSKHVIINNGSKTEDNEPQSAENESQSTENESQTEDNESQSTENESQTEDNESQSTENESQTEDNESQSAENESQTEDNESKIAENESQIVENESPLERNESEFFNCEPEIVENDKDILDNKSQFAENLSQILDRESEIAQNELLNWSNELQLLNNHSQIVEDESHIVGNGLIILDNKYQTVTSESQTVENESQIVGCESQGVEDQSQILDNEAQTVQNELQNGGKELESLNNESHILEDESLILDNESQALTNDLQILENESQIVNYESQGVENESQMSDNVSQNELQISENVSLMVENESQILDKGLQIPDGGSPLEAIESEIMDFRSQNADDESQFVDIVPKTVLLEVQIVDNGSLFEDIGSPAVIIGAHIINDVSQDEDENMDIESQFVHNCNVGRKKHDSVDNKAYKDAQECEILQFVGSAHVVDPILRLHPCHESSFDSSDIVLDNSAIEEDIKGACGSIGDQRASGQQVKETTNVIKAANQYSSLHNTNKGDHKISHKFHMENYRGDVGKGSLVGCLEKTESLMKETANMNNNITKIEKAHSLHDKDYIPNSNELSQVCRDPHTIRAVRGGGGGSGPGQTHTSTLAQTSTGPSCTTHYMGFKTLCGKSTENKMVKKKFKSSGKEQNKDVNKEPETLDTNEVFTPDEEKRLKRENSTTEATVVKDSIKAPQLLHGIQAELFPDCSGNLKLFCHFGEIHADSTITWIKDSKLLARIHRSSKDDSPVSLAIVQTSKKDQGQYSCTLKNIHGKVATEFHLTAEVLDHLAHNQDSEGGEEIEFNQLFFREDFITDMYFGGNLHGRIATDELHFGEGVHRKAFRSKVMCGLFPVFNPGHLCVLKVHNAIAYGAKNNDELVQKNYKLAVQECYVQNTAREYAKIYAAEAEQLEAFGKVPEIIPIFLIHRPANNIPYATVEEELIGDFVKYSIKDGKEINVLRKDSEAGQKCCTFQHWVYERTNGNLLVTDMQGVGMKLTDVGIATMGKGYKGFKGNCSVSFIDQFKALHQCNKFCEILGLQSLRPNTSKQKKPNPVKEKAQPAPSSSRKNRQSTKPKKT
ncbi:alpha-protein kinase 2 [Hyla sarda]|uniref:alpha-protein kinase 2 n=1 Tax=Hyla sarda TaxID=327740 RepID=UPI0024C33CC2|nr:alpha-protein kinase 2 [Hyla sarda]XP_056400315.1 alpha-protein kinase 2 [Hyla sarda]XP_056400324.1 alpha-protein kinase 2 [Hyla sarda]XP_056400331.1 alpha-protein kinase 2 [Hyla sarda]XP_056400339.1 alpha-protein kinase 2 [Hyla sarda]XP_056400346.1 alpha-protein kinase 2 [Hyla sarda]